LGCFNPANDEAYLKSLLKLFARSVGSFLLPLSLQPLVLEVDGVLPPDDDHVQGRVKVGGPLYQAVDEVGLSVPGNIHKPNTNKEDY